MDRQRALDRVPDPEHDGEDRRENRRARRQRHVVQVAHVVRDQRAEDADDHHHGPVGGREIPAQAELHEQQHGQNGAGDVRGVDEAEAEVVVHVVGSGLADRGAHDLDDPEEEGDLRDLVQHLASSHARKGAAGGLTAT